MKQVNLHGRNDVRVDDVAAPLRADGDVLIEVETCGICGSDLHYVASGGALFGSTTPMALGHEFAGVVVEPGASRFQIGQRVVVNPAKALSRGVIGNGGQQGALAEYLVVAKEDADGALIPVPASLSPELAALAEPLSVGLHAINRADVQPGQRVVVLGVGCIGMGIIAGLAARGINDVVAVDISPRRLEAATRLGARNCVRAGAEDLRERLEALYGKVMVFGMLPAVGADVYFDTTASPAVLRDTIAMAQQRALIVYVGLYTQHVSLDLMQALHREVDLRAAVAYEDEFSAALRLLTDARIDFNAMISHRFPLEQFNQAFGIAQNAQASLKVMITCSQNR
ncbi:MAG TPA: zinc-binding dehydrogenase [Steroidobacteraceae bacterium]|nr:zinc-binding dehydrogenase [Steroidobacteraceae bacterium]